MLSLGRACVKKRAKEKNGSFNNAVVPFLPSMQLVLVLKLGDVNLKLGNIY